MTEISFEDAMNGAVPKPSRLKVTATVSIAEHSANKLYFINLLNTLGPGGKPKIFDTYFVAGKSVRGLSNIAEKLTPMELQGLIQLIENRL